MVEREPCMQAANYAFELARSNGWSVTSSSKHTIQKVTDGLFESVVSEVAERYPYVEHQKELFDALLGKIIVQPDNYEVVLVLNEYGDFLSDLAAGLVGSLGTGASGNFAFDDAGRVSMAMFDPAHGTAPDIAGQNKANPSAMFLAVTMMLIHIGETGLSNKVRDAVRGAIGDGECTGDLGGKLTTKEFTKVVIDRIS
jgi:isocitrate dehydrogenase (NAD+)